jgi:LPPG:FO 2-phospho-L-lactate transferase
MIACLGGGVGAARMWRALAGVVGGHRLAIVVNTADDVWRHGLRVCPDIDTNLYWLSGRADEVRGWGLRGETFRCMEGLRGLGEDAWFALGDGDLATHLLRTEWLRDGVGLAEVTARMAAAMGVEPAVLPMCEQEVRTEVRVGGAGWIGYQDFLVRRRAAGRVLDVRWAGIGAATPAPGVLAAIAAAEVVILGPSNPMASMLPILAVPGIRAALAAAPARVVAVTPVVAGVPIEDPGDAGRARSRAALLAARGVEHRAGAVAGLYRDVAGAFVLDVADAEEAAEVAAHGLEPVVAPTLVHLDASAAAALAGEILGVAA